MIVMIGVASVRQTELFDLLIRNNRLKAMPSDVLTSSKNEEKKNNNFDADVQMDCQHKTLKNKFKYCRNMSIVSMEESFFHLFIHKCI